MNKIDRYFIHILRSNILKPKPDKNVAWIQTKMESYCVAKTRYHILKPKQKEDSDRSHISNLLGYWCRFNKLPVFIVHSHSNAPQWQSVQLTFIWQFNLFILNQANPKMEFQPRPISLHKSSFSFYHHDVELKFESLEKGRLRYIVCWRDVMWFEMWDIVEDI